jgi:hypothetical protein
MTRYLWLFGNYGRVSVGRPLWREDGSVFCICCSPCQCSLSRIKPLGTRDHILLFPIWDFPFRRLLFSKRSNTRIYVVSSKYCHVSQWLRRGFGLVNRFIGSSLVVATISSYTLKTTVTIAHVTSHTKSSNSSSGHTAVPLELRNSSPFPFPYSLISSRHGPRTKNTVLLLRSADHTENNSHDNYLASQLARWLLPSN